MNQYFFWNKRKKKDHNDIHDNPFAQRKFMKTKIVKYFDMNRTDYDFDDDE